MQNRDVKIIVCISFIALLVLCALQINWTLDAYTLTQKQYEHRVTLALNEAMDKISRSTEFFRGCTNSGCEHYNDHSSSLEQVVNYQYLDKVLEESFHKYNLDTVYRYKLFNASERTCDSRGIFSNSAHLNPHDGCTTWQADEYELGVFFPEMNKSIMKSMLGGIFLSTILILYVIFAIYYIVSTILRQKRLSEIKNDFINNMTHEFKTPLATISLAAEILQKSDPLLARQRIMKYSNIIQEENLRLRKQVDYILKAARIQKKQLDLQPTAIDVHAQIRETLECMCLDSNEKPVKLFLELDAACHHVFVDKLHFTNIINNLVSNAVKYSGDSVSILITTRNKNGRICIIIHDDGIGIEKEHQKHIFDKFYRVSSGNVHDVKGFGLGLYYVKEMVQAHKGEVWLDSEPGKGTIFTVSIPYINQN